MRTEPTEKPERLENGMPELKACPFCGSLGVAVVGFGARCGTCGAVGPFGPTEEEAARRWNERAKYPAAGETEEPPKRGADEKSTGRRGQDG